MRRAAALAALLLCACGDPPAPPASARERADLSPGARDRLELVRQPRRGWRAPARRRLSLQLLLERDRIRAGERLGYRLELRNEGGGSVSFKEAAPSFVKDGSLCGRGWKLLAAPEGGREEALPCAPAQGGEALEVVLRPGEYLLTRPAGAFRPLLTARVFDRPGRYRVRAVYAEGGARAESAAAGFEVVP